MERIQNYIDGQLIAPVSGNYLDVYEPAIGEVYCSAPDSDNKDVELAVAAASRAFPIWSVMPKEQRGDILTRIANLITERLDELALAESRDNGKPLWLAKSVDIPRASSNFQFFASAIQHFASESHDMEGQAINYTLRQPVGIVGCISPWNLPLYLFSWKIAPALAAGNCVIAKPSEITPMTAYMLSQICIEAKLPPGVLNILHGYGHNIGQTIVEHSKIPTISFTGGTVTGARIAAIAAPMFKKLSLELGGKNPNIVFADCNFEDMIENTLRSSFANQGQICLCGSRIFVERSLYEKFRGEIVKRAKNMRVGDPLLPESQQGAVVSQQHMEKVLSCIETAKQEGGVVLCGGKRAMIEGRCAAGWFIEPTVIENLSPECQTNQQEIFGPVVTITPFDDEQQVIAHANSTAYGLSATIWTENLQRAHRVAYQIKSGVVWINCWLIRDLRTPFGGMKNSGVGREGGWEALRFFTEAKNVCVKL